MAERCADCGRPRVTDRQQSRWTDWACITKRGRGPLWFRLGLRCMGWYDCTADWIDHNPDASNPWIRWCYRRRRSAHA